jgi:hypothetical protein
MARSFTPDQVREMMAFLRRCHNGHFEEASSAGAAAYYRVACEVPTTTGEVSTPDDNVVEAAGQAAANLAIAIKLTELGYTPLEPRDDNSEGPV